MDDALNQEVGIATEEVFETFLGWQITSVAPVESTINVNPAEISVIISLEGNLSGAPTLKCSAKLVTEIASQMLGTEIEASSDDMKDAIGGDYTVYIKANKDDKISLLEFQCNNDDVVIQIFLV